MRVLQVLLMILLAALLLPAHRASANAVNPEPAYITGTVNFPGFTTTSISMTAVGGGNTAQQTTSGSTYQLPVAGGDWIHAVSATCGLRDADGNTVTVSFSQRSVVVAPGATVTNDYDFSNAGFIRFEVNIVGDQPESWVSAGAWATKAVASGEEKTASYSFGTTSNVWLLPVIPNQQIELTAKIDVTGASGEMQRFSFSKTALSPYQLAPVDVAPGAVVTVPLQINFLDGGSPPPTYAYSGYLSGSVSLLGLPTSNFEKHSFASKSLFANPGVYTSNAISVPTGIQATYSPGTVRTYFLGLDGSPLTWPWINGDSNNNKATIYPNTTTYLNLERNGGSLAGTINFSGSVSNDDLKAVTVAFSGVRDYNPVTKQWSNRDTYGGSSNLNRDTAAYAKPPTVRDYEMFLPSGDWGVTTMTLTKQLQSPLRSSTVTFRDHAIQYDGKDYFGSPLSIEPGDNQQDFNYCLGSAIFRFRDPDGRLLSSPQVSGSGIHQTNGVTDLTISSISATSTESNAVMPEVEVFGPAGNYAFPTVRVTPAGSVSINYGPRNLSLACNTTKILDFPGPTLNVLSPQGEIITNTQTIPVAGRAFGGSTIASVTVNGQSAALTPVAGGKPNEVSFTQDLVLEDGESTITVTAIEMSGAQATDQLIIFADRWQPSVSIVNLADGDFIPSTQIEVPLHVEAADRGYGYTFAIHLDGALIHSAVDAGNIMTPASLSYNAALSSLSLGEHRITATVSDKAGNSSSASITILVDDPPPVLYGLIDQVIEATAASGAAASFGVTATASCNTDLSPTAFQTPVLTPQNNSTTAGNSVSKTFQWSAVTAPDGHAVQYQIQLSDSLDFSTIRYNSEWQAGTTWTQSLSVGTWYWRVMARDSVHPALESIPATGNSFSILNEGLSTAKFSILHHSDCTFSGGVYPDAGADMWVGPFDGVDVDRSFLMFDTSSIGTDVTITSVNLMLDFQVRDFLQNESLTEVRESTWELPGAYNGYVGELLASQPISAARPLGMVAFNIRPDYVQENGITKFALKASNEDFYSLYNSAPGYKRATSYLEVAFAPNTTTWAEPTLTPQENAASSGELVDRTLQWGEVAAADGDPVEFLVEISSAPNFSTIDFSSPWQTRTSWTHSLPTGTWYWRVTARDAAHTTVTSSPAASSFNIAYQPAPTPPGEATATCSQNSGDIFPLGATTVTCTARDACNRTATGSFTITVQDTMPPELAVPADMIVEASSAAGAPVEFNLLASDTVDLSPAVICIPASGSVFPIGTTSVTCTASDASGNKAAEAFGITVEDPRPPVLTVPADISVEATGPLSPVEIGQASATHILPFTIRNDAPDSYPVATTVVIWTATDTNGKAASGVQNVTVTDTTPPMVTVPANLTIEAAGTLTQVSTDAATATDAVGVISITSDAPAAFPLGMTTVTWTATDAAGNIGVAVQTVTVVDQTPPTLLGLANLNLEAASASGAVATFSVTANDLVDPAATVTCSAASGSTFPLGATAVNCTATDASGNSIEGAFNVTVVVSTPPVLTVPVNKTAEATGSLTPVDIGQASFTHILPVTLSNDAPEAYPVATTVVTWTVVDAYGNTASGTQNVTVADTTAPVVTAPANLTVEASGTLSQVSAGAATATDSVGVISITSDAPAAFPLGMTTVTWTATDAAGNIGVAVQTVTVVDQTPPTLLGLANLNLEAASASGAVATFSVTANDLVDPAATVTCSAASGSTLPLGATAVTCTATDASGNSGNGNFTITVRDTTSPNLTVPEGITVLLNTPLNSQEVQDFLNGATAVDTVDASVSVTATTPEVFNTVNATSSEVFNTVGTKQVTFTAVDNSGNQTARTATIRVVYGCGDEFMEPVSLLKPFKQGSTVPVKIGFCDASGAAATSAVVRLFLYPVSNEVPAEEPIEIQSPGTEDTGNLFKVAGDEYHYNLKTTNLSPGTFQIRAVLDDGTIRAVSLAVK